MARGTSDDAAPHVRLHSAPQATSLCEPVFNRRGGWRCRRCRTAAVWENEEQEARVADLQVREESVAFGSQSISFVLVP